MEEKTIIELKSMVYDEIAGMETTILAVQKAGQKRIAEINAVIQKKQLEEKK